MKSVEVDFYETLGVTKTASQQQIKQSYKKLALKYHPDKNANKEQAKSKFVTISEAYAVLNDPEKRKNYDLYGTADLDLDSMNFQDFMDGDFDMFEEFLQEFLAFDTLEKMFTQMAKGGKKGKSVKAKGRKKNKGKSSSYNTDLDKDLQRALFQALQGGLDFNDPDLDLMGIDLEQAQKQLQKMILASDEDQDQQELSELQMNVLAFGQRNIQKKKVGSKKKKKKQIRCKICTEKVEEDQILLHFSEKHMKQFEQEQKNGVKDNNIKKEQNNNTKKQQEQIDY